ncbi:MAG: DUF2779 domain-containing protein [Bacteroidia bacterium]|nr:DUF2779 domain-containing protein [Bacteroidia bacterium]
MYKNFIQMRDQPSAEQQAIFSRGNNVGVLAQKLFPGGVDATPAKRSDNLLAVQKTKDLIDSGAEVIYEAAFQYDQVLAILDILVKKEGKWYAYEVKSSVKISNTYLLDASLQYWVITNSGIALEDISLVTLNSKYVRKGELNIQDLFAKTSVLKDVLKNQVFISEKAPELKTVALSAAMPDMAIGEQCFSPYGCDFMGTCWKNVPKGSVFEISGLPKAEQFALYSSGIRLIDEIPAKNALDKNVNIHLKSLKADEVYLEKERLTDFISKLRYPLYFMDFETFMPAVPIYEGTKPYQHIPFQYSIHYYEKEGGELRHVDFLAEHGKDPRRAFLKNLLEHLKGAEVILVYDALMERNVLNGLKKDFPEFLGNIDLILSKLLDLMQVFQERIFYHPLMKNSHSIKNVLPALVPGLGYENLSISSGSIAMIAFEKLQNEQDMFKALEIREQLIEYCKLDTFAMVKLLEVLKVYCV